jgi:hypothetical protein
MNLPSDSVIARDKVFRYLLVFRAKGDKSKLLARAGYDLSNGDRLIEDLRTQVLPLDATPTERSEYGQFYEIRAPLTGPSGHTIHIVAIWMTEHLSGVTKFITLIRDKRRRS